VREKPILFSAPMVRAILSGSKSQTRRIVKPQPIMRDGGDCVVEYGKQRHSGPAEYLLGHVLPRFGCPYGQPGDRLWVRETFITGCEMDENGYFKTDDAGNHIDKIWYRASTPDLVWYDGDDGSPGNPRWKPSIFMPRSASRLTLEITAVRVDRLQEISEADAQAEGIERVGGEYSCSPWRNYRIGQPGEMSCHCSSKARSYMTLWESINGPGSWAANPWVWVIEFKRVSP